MILAFATGKPKASLVEWLHDLESYANAEWGRKPDERPPEPAEEKIREQARRRGAEKPA